MRFELQCLNWLQAAATFSTHPFPQAIDNYASRYYHAALTTESQEEPSLIHT